MDSQAEGLVLRILIELVPNELEFIKDAIGVISITITEEELSLIIKGIPLLSGSILQYIPLFLKASASILINGLEPVLEFRITVRISVDIVERFK